MRCRGLRVLRLQLLLTRRYFHHYVALNVFGALAHNLADFAHRLKLFRILRILVAIGFSNAALGVW